MVKELVTNAGWWYTYPSWKMMEFVNGMDYPIYEMEKKQCSKPPTSQLTNDMGLNGDMTGNKW